MKKERNIFCNLCQKSLSQDDFMDHLPSNHLPKPHLTCILCQTDQSSLQDLEQHLNSQHKSDTTRQVFHFRNLFVNSSDISSHIENCAEWIRKSFSFGFNNVLNKKEIRSVVKKSYSQENAKDIVCESCNDTEKCSHCGYCGEQFLRKCHLKIHVFKHLLLPDSIRKAINLCEICGSIFPNSRTLQQHRNRTHRKLFAKENTRKNPKTPPFCHFCGKSLANKSNLKRHVLNQHSEEIGAPPNNNVFTCDYCKCFFSNKSSVKRHIENLHLKMKDTRKSISCFQCEQRFNSIKNLNAHLTIEHNVTINEEKLQFSNLTEFWSWKQEEEIRTNSRFIQLRGLRRQRRKGEEISTLKFVCNRSGIFHSKSNGKRAYRIKGSSKIGRYCSAYIEIMFKENALVDGVYCSTHSGHDNDLRYLTLTMDEKREIYEKIKGGATFSAILNEIRNSVGKEIKRKHLVTNKDLHNIVTTFKKLPKSPESDDPNLPSSDLPDLSSDHQSVDRNERNFNNDLDLCADLWVETCQRMINRFDQNESRINDLCKDTESKNTYVNDISNSESRHKMNRVPATDFSRISYANDYTPNGLSNVIQPCYKAPHYQGYDSGAGDKLSNVSYFGNVSRMTPARETKDFCGISTITNDLRLSKEFYSVEIENHVANEVKIPSVCATGYTSMDSSAESNDSSGYLQNTNVYDKLTDTNAVDNQDLYNSYDFGNKLPPVSHSQVCSSSTQHDDLDNDLISNESILSEDTEPSEPSHGNDKREVSDLRDRVNSVTALYNIVESELDERKKNIIRNYVDNMFRVLQYRYNKCKTKKKGSEKQSPQNKSNKRLQSNKTPNKSKDAHPKPMSSFCDSSGYVHKVPDDSFNNPLNNSITNLRPDAGFLRWDQY